jgi:hypothetical protein
LFYNDTELFRHFPRIIRNGIRFHGLCGVYIIYVYNNKNSKYQTT